MKKALIIVDMQNDFAKSEAPMYVKNAEQTVPVINDLLNLFNNQKDLIIFTKDWHPQNHGSFASNHPGHNVFDQVLLGTLPQVLWPDHCVQNSHGSEIVDGINQVENAIIIEKGLDPAIDSYSAFFDNGRLAQTELDNILKKNKVSEVVVCGLALDYCVKFTALDAHDLGYKTFVVNEATKAVNLNPNDADQTIKDLRSVGVHYISMEDIKKRFAKKENQIEL